MSQDDQLQGRLALKVPFGLHLAQVLRQSGDAVVSLSHASGRARTPAGGNAGADTPLRCRRQTVTSTTVEDATSFRFQGDLQTRRDRTRVPFGTGRMAQSHLEDRSNLNRWVPRSSFVLWDTPQAVQESDLVSPSEAMQTLDRPILATRFAHTQVQWTSASWQAPHLSVQYRSDPE